MRRRLVLALALLVGPPPTAPFVLNGGARSHNPKQLPGGAYRWTVPADSHSTEGLGGGIGYVVDENFCKEMLSRFPERDLFHGLEWSAMQFVHCNDIMVALERGFATWSANHRLISFTDLKASAPCSEASSRTGKVGDTCPWELYIGTDDGKDNADLAAYVINYRAHLFHKDWFDRPLRSSAGEVVYGVDAHERSVMNFQTHLCWYLDATFCYGFQYLHEEENVDVLLIVRAILICVFGLAVLRVSTILFWCLVALTCLKGTRAQRIHKRDGFSTGCAACLDYLSSLSPIGNVVVLFLVIFPPVFYERIFLPCWECYDFEAAMAHETGHVLGFGHPDADPSNNLAAACRITNSTCRDPFSSCAYHEDYSSGKKSIMHSLTQHTPRTCLSSEDMHGLYLLYPLCDDLEPTSVSCTKARRLSGWLRLAIVVGVPFLICVIVILVPLSCLRWRDQRIMRQLDRELGSAQSTIRAYQSELNSALRSTARDALARPATSLLGNRPATALHSMRHMLGRSNRVQPNDVSGPSDGRFRAPTAPSQPAGSGLRSAPGRGARPPGRSAAAPDMAIEELEETEALEAALAASLADARPQAHFETAGGRKAPGRPRAERRQPPPEGRRVTQGHPVAAAPADGTYNGYTGVAWPGGTPNRNH